MFVSFQSLRSIKKNCKKSNGNGGNEQMEQS